MVPDRPAAAPLAWTRAMTGAGECGEIRHSLGVYLLGAISPAERSAVDRHLAWCADCRAELTGLAALPGRLGSVPAADVTSLAGYEADGAVPGAGPPQVPLAALLDRAARVRRRLRWRRLAVAAAAIVIAGGGAVAGSRVLEPRPRRLGRGGGAVGRHGYRQRLADGHVRHREVPARAVGTGTAGTGQRDLPGDEVRVAGRWTQRAGRAGGGLDSRGRPRVGVVPGLLPIPRL